MSPSLSNASLVGKNLRARTQTRTQMQIGIHTQLTGKVCPHQPWCRNALCEHLRKPRETYKLETRDHDL